MKLTRKIKVVKPIQQSSREKRADIKQQSVTRPTRMTSVKHRILNNRETSLSIREQRSAFPIVEAKDETDRHIMRNFKKK